MTNISTIAQSLNQIERFKTMQADLATLQYQLSSGKKARLFSELGGDVTKSERARANFQSLETYINNIDVAARRSKMMTNAIQETQAQAENILNALVVQTQEGEIELASINKLAGDIQNYLITLYNQNDGDRYLFGGAETQDLPLNDTGALDTYLQTNISNWVNTGPMTVTSDQLISSYRDTTQLNDTIVGYSAKLSSGSTRGVYVRVDERAEMEYTVRANEANFRDVLVSVSMIKNLTGGIDEVTLESTDATGTVTAPGADRSEQSDNFYAVFNDLAEMLTTAIDGLDQSHYDLSQMQARMSQIRDNHEQDKNVQASIISDVEDADMNDTAVKLNLLQVQMEAAYRVTASISDLTLVNFI